MAHGPCWGRKCPERNRKELDIDVIVHNDRNTGCPCIAQYLLCTYCESYYTISLPKVIKEGCYVPVFQIGWFSILSIENSNILERSRHILRDWHNTSLVICTCPAASTIYWGNLSFFKVEQEHPVVLDHVKVMEDHLILYSSAWHKQACLRLSFGISNAETDTLRADWCQRAYPMPHSRPKIYVNENPATAQFENNQSVRPRLPANWRMLREHS